MLYKHEMPFIVCIIPHNGFLTRLTPGKLKELKCADLTQIYRIDLEFRVSIFEALRVLLLMLESAWLAYLAPT